MGTAGSKNVDMKKLNVSGVIHMDCSLFMTVTNQQLFKGNPLMTVNYFKNI